MSMDLAVQNFSTAPEYFLAGDCLMDVAKSVKTAAEDIPAHAPVKLDSSGKLALLTAKTDDIYGLMPDSIRADEDGPVWLTGEYFADSLVLPEGITAADIEISLRKIGIFLQ